MSIAQPSPQGLAALSMGNPAPLQKRVAESPKNPQTGLPEDLVAALALSINLTTQNAMQRQEAMNQLQQAAGGAGNMPTVIQSLQAAAKQKLQSRPTPQAAPPQGQPEQPEEPQAAGLAQAPVEFGMAGGGLVSFSDGKKVPKAEDEEESLYERYLEGPATAAGAGALGVGTVKAYRTLKDIATSLGTTVPEILRSVGKDVGGGVKSVGRTAVSGPAMAVGAGGEAATRFATDVMAGNEKLREAYKDNMLLGAMDPDGALAASILSEAKDSPENLKKQPAPAAPVALPPTGAGAGRGRVNPPMAIPTPAPAAASPIDDLEKAIAQPPRGAGAGAAAQAKGLLGAIPMDPRLEKMANLDPSAREKEVMERMKGLAPDTSSYDRLISEYERRKKELEGPKDPYGRLMEYFEQIAAAGPQRRIGEAGAKGAAGLKALQKEREQQLFDLTKEQISLADKKNEAQRAFKMDVFKTGQDVYNKTYDQVFNALKEKGQNDRQASANATQLATNAATVAEQARGHTLLAQTELARLKTSERRADKEEAALSLKALSEAAKELGALLKDPAYATTNEAAQTRTQLNQITAEIAKRGGITNMGFSATPTAPVAGKLK